jgi:hypothetical protein
LHTLIGGTARARGSTNQSVQFCAICWNYTVNLKN